jgi:tRNA-specific 2-thiouridylase
MPLGALNKEQVRALAAGMGLPAAAKPDSMEICFIPDGDYAAYIERRGAVPPPGDFIYHGRVVGRHRGIHHYTVGQRRHFGVYVGHRVYVSEIRPDTNEVVLSDGDMLWAHEICIRDMNWLIDEPAAPIACGVRVRHSRTAPAPATAEVRPGGGLHIVLRGPVRAPTAGQSAALYDGGRLLGGGLITFSE